MNNVSLGFTLLVAGLVIFASSLMKTTGSMLGGLIYGAGALKTPASSTPGPTITQGKGTPVPGLVVPDVKPTNGANVYNSLNPGAHNPTVKG